VFTNGEPPVLLGGWGQAMDRSAAQNAGFDRHITKPVDPNQLLGVL
jgi:CheY-like chemotaxis protein